MATMSFTDPARARVAVLDRRLRRYHSFKVVFTLAYAGIVLDIVTTAINSARTGAGYEQNPLGSTLIHGVGYAGLFVMLTAFAALLFVSFRTVCLHASPRVSGFLTSLLALVTFIRWIAVVTAILYMVQTG